MIHNSSRQQRSLQQEHFDSLHRDKTETLSNYKLFSAKWFRNEELKKLRFFWNTKNLRSGASILLQAQMHIAEGRIESLSFELHCNSVNEWSQIFPEKNLLNSCTYMTEISKQISILYGSFITLLLSHPNAKTLIWSQIVLLTTASG